MRRVSPHSPFIASSSKSKLVVWAARSSQGPIRSGLDGQPTNFQQTAARFAPGLLQNAFSTENRLLLRRHSPKLPEGHPAVWSRRGTQAVKGFVLRRRLESPHRQVDSGPLADRGGHRLSNTIPASTSFAGQHAIHNRRFHSRPAKCLCGSIRNKRFCP